MMKRICRILLASLILICCIPFVSAYTINNVNIAPSGSLTPGQRVSVTYEVSLPLVSGQTFEPTNTLDMYTDLAAAKWSIVKTETVVGISPIEKPLFNQVGPRAQVGGWILSYTDRELSLRITLDGVAPQVDKTQTKTIIKITELDSYSKPVSTTGYVKEAIVVNIADINNAISVADSNLQVFRVHIDEKYALDVDTSVAEGKYNQAKAAIDSVRSQSSSQYEVALAGLTNAQNLIADGEKALDKAWAEKAVADAHKPTTVPTTGESTIVTTKVLTTILTTTTPDPIIKLLEEQNKKIDEQNKLIDAQNKKLAEQSGILDQILNYFKRIFGWS